MKPQKRQLAAREETIRTRSHPPTSPPPQHDTGPIDCQLPDVLRFVLPDHTTFDVLLQPEMVIGRRTSRQDGQVDIDLGPHGAHELGISRYHAVIQNIDGRLHIKDFDSTNGTTLNGHLLPPLEAYRLRDGDTLALGYLTLTVRYIQLAGHQNQRHDNQARVEAMMSRIATIQWGKPPLHVSSSTPNSVLMQEFLRRMLLWSKALGVNGWPLFDVAKVLQPGLRPATRKLNPLTRGLFPNIFVRMTCHWALHWAEIAGSQMVQEFGLPDPYEPLLEMYECGAWFKRSNTVIEIWDTPGLISQLPLTPELYDRQTPFTETEGGALTTREMSRLEV